MKKITYLFAAMVAALGFSARNETWDDNPTLITREGDEVIDFLNTPVEANTSILITDDNKTGELKLTGSQPTEYGYAATVGYQLEMALNEDFTTPVVAKDGVPASVVLGTFYDLKNINPTLRSVAEGMCKMLDIPESATVPTDYMPVYMRLRANVVNENKQNIANTSFTSNTVCYKKVCCGYLAIIVPGLSRDPAIYISGGMNDWLNPQLNNGEDMDVLPKYEFLTTSEADTYELDYIEIAAGVEFKIADKGWGDPNISTDGVISQFDTWLPCVWDAGNSSFTENFKGSITAKGSGQNWQLYFAKAEPDTPGQPSGMYIKGDFNGWKDQPEYEFMTTDVKNTWKTGVVTITAGGFKVADAGWSSPNLGSNGEPFVVNQKYTCDNGGSNITLTENFTGVITLRLKTGKWILLFEPSN